MNHDYSKLPSDPSQGSHRIDEFYAFLTVDADGNEGLCVAQGPRGLVTLVASDVEMVRTLAPIAARAAQTSGVRLRLVRFSTREDVQTFDPNADQVS